MKKLTYLTFALGLVFASCNAQQESNEEESDKEKKESQVSWESQEEAFTSSCEKSYVSGFKNTFGEENLYMVDLAELDNIAEEQCGCMFNKIKEKYETPVEAFSKGFDQLMMEVEECEPTEAQMSKLLKEDTE
ncbi:MAG: hypothetical protein ACFHU9_11255 [Fluviicola sp.]